MLSHGALEPDIFIPVWLQTKCMLKGNPFPETNRCENKPKVIRSFQKKSSFPTGISLITCWTNVGKMKWAKHHEFKFQFKDEELLLAKPSLPRIEQKPTLSEQWWEQCVDTYNGCVHSISLFYMCHSVGFGEFILVSKISLRIHDTVIFNGVWMCGMEDGFIFSAIISGIAGSCCWIYSANGKWWTLHNSQYLHLKKFVFWQKGARATREVGVFHAVVMQIKYTEIKYNGKAKEENPE